MGFSPSTVVNIALSEVGYLEKKTNSNLDDKTANAGTNNYTKYGRDMHALYPSVMDFPAAWCDAFVDWCFYKAYGVATAKSLLGGNFDDYTVASAQMFKNKGGWLDYKATPAVGDQIFFVTSGKAQTIANICHTGIVYAVDSKYVYTVEGNTSGANGVVANGGGVAKKSYLRTYNRIAGYGRPAYGTITVASPVTATPAGTPVKVASKVAVAKYFDKSVAGTYYTTASSLRLRTDAKTNTNDNIIRDMPNGTRVICYGYYNVLDGVKWPYVTLSDGTLGYCSSKYLRK